MTVALPTRLLIADAHPILVRGLEALLRANRDFEVVATCLNGVEDGVEDGVEAREKIQAVEPDLAVLDLALPGLTGLDLLAALSRAGSRVRVILLTAAATDQQIVKAVADGAWGLVLKDATAEDLLACLRSVVNGARWLPPALVDAALDREAERRRERGVSDVTLTAREREIAALVATGLSNKAIARTIGLSDGTVRIHLSNIYQKLGISNRTALPTHASLEGQPGPIPENQPVERSPRTTRPGSSACTTRCLGGCCPPHVRDAGSSAALAAPEDILINRRSLERATQTSEARSLPALHSREDIALWEHLCRQ